MLTLAIDSELFQPIWLEEKKALWLNSTSIKKDLLLDLIEYQYHNTRCYTGRYIRIKITHLDKQSSMPDNFTACSFTPILYGTANSAKASQKDREMFS
jgi:hypothetical protein